jgi:hypothetical protein
MTEQIEQIPIESYAEAYANLHGRVKDDLWAMADICAAVITNYGEKSVQQFIDALKQQGVQLSQSYFYALVKPSKFFPENSTRVENLSFTHFRTAANMSETAQEAQSYIALASDQNWTIPQLGENIYKMTGRKKDNERRKLQPNPTQVFALEIEVDLAEWQEFQSAIKAIETDYTNLADWVRGKIFEYRRNV